MIPFRILLSTLFLFILTLITFEGRNLEMPPKELELLYFLASRPNQVFTREQILDKLWQYEYVGDTRTVVVLNIGSHMVGLNFLRFRRCLLQGRAAAEQCSNPCHQFI